MKRLALAASAACLIAVLVAAPAASQSTIYRSTTLDPCIAHPHPAKEQRKLAAVVFRRARWQRPEPPPGRVAEMQILRKCAPPSARPAMRNRWRTDKRRLYRYRAYRRIAPYPGPSGTWWAVPYPIVSCESGGSWSAENPSGARGPYQLLGHGEPWPVTGWHDKMAHHRIAAELYRSSGTGPWVSSEPCWSGY